jgi:hypothetical protein
MVERVTHIPRVKPAAPSDIELNGPHSRSFVIAVFQVGLELVEFVSIAPLAQLSVNSYPGKVQNRVSLEDNNDACTLMPDNAEPLPLPGNEVSDPESGFKATIPNGWNGQKVQGLLLLQNPRIPGVIIVSIQYTWTKESLEAEMQKEIRDPTTLLAPARQVTEAAPGLLSMGYNGTVNGAPAIATGFCKYFEGAGAVVVAAVAARGQFGPQLEAAALFVLKSIAFTHKPAPSTDLRAAFASTWVTISTNFQSRFVLNPDGTYVDDYESSFSGQIRNETLGVQTGYWGVAGQNRDTGRWEARGTRERGVFVITKANGAQETYEYHVHVEKGKMYWNEYYIGGRLYSRS